VSAGPAFDVVIPTVGRTSLHRVLEAVLFGTGPEPARVVVVDDRPTPDTAIRVPAHRVPVFVLRSYGSGPAGARNVGWTAGEAAWVAFLDDDVEPPYDWRARLAADLAAVDANARVAGSQGRVVVPMPSDRRPTDWERDVAGLAGARWITADLAYRRAALHAVGGFDERFRGAYREDSDLALQVHGRVGAVVWGGRHVVHPVRPARWTASVERQRGNFDDALMRRRYGPSWRHAAGAFPTRFRAHAITTAFGVAGLAALCARRRRAAAGAGLLWLVSTLRFSAERARPGPRRRAELATLTCTSAVIPPTAVWQRLRGELRVLADVRAGLTPAARVGPRSPRRAVLFDRDGTLVHDIPYNGDPGAVQLVDGAAQAVAALRAAGMRVAVVTNQSGIARGLLTHEAVAAVHRRIERELGPVDEWLVCAHGPDDGCGCRKPAPGMVLDAAARFGISPALCVVIGDTEADVAAARAAGARGILVANAATRPSEIDGAPETAPDLRSAVARVLEQV
jgi:histidinol-phosphate phosphatase family protein